MPEQIS
jgi:hypothetical protein